jgi:hypothetical protein
VELSFHLGINIKILVQTDLLEDNREREKGEGRGMVEFTDHRWELQEHWSWSRSPSRLLMEAAHGQRRSVKKDGVVEIEVTQCSVNVGMEELPVTTAPLT